MNTPTELSYRVIHLTQGQITLVDAADYDHLMQWGWYAARYKTKYYAVRGQYRDGRTRILGMHRQIMGLFLGDRRQVDHHFHNTLDNRRFIDGIPNLRIATHSQNMRNRGIPAHNSSGVVGVRWYKAPRLWCAFVCVGGKELYLGSSPDKAVAIALRLEGERQYYGEFAFNGAGRQSVESTPRMQDQQQSD